MTITDTAHPAPAGTAADERRPGRCAPQVGPRRRSARSRRPAALPHRPPGRRRRRVRRHDRAVGGHRHRPGPVVAPPNRRDHRRTGHTQRRHPVVHGRRDTMGHPRVGHAGGDVGSVVGGRLDGADPGVLRHRRRRLRHGVRDQPRPSDDDGSGHGARRCDLDDRDGAPTTDAEPVLPRTAHPRRSNGIRDGRLDPRWIWAMPVLTTVWANLHSGYLTGIVVLGVYAVFERLEARRPGGERPARDRRSGASRSSPWSRSSPQRRTRAAGTSGCTRSRRCGPTRCGATSSSGTRPTSIRRGSGPSPRCSR